MRKFFTALVLIPLGAIFLVFAIANRQFVTVSFDPFNSGNPAAGLTLPLFVVIIVVAILGVIAGGVATWLGQHHWRRAARQSRAEAREAGTELARLRAAMAPARETAVPVLLPHAASPAAGPRDKSGATL